MTVFCIAKNAEWSVSGDFGPHILVQGKGRAGPGKREGSKYDMACLRRGRRGRGKEGSIFLWRCFVVRGSVEGGTEAKRLQTPKKKKLYGIAANRKGLN